MFNFVLENTGISLLEDVKYSIMVSMGAQKPITERLSVSQSVNLEDHNIDSTRVTN